MLYLPPKYAHNGIAEDDCMTYSIGFRALSHNEVMTQFLVYLQDKVETEGRYSDPGLQLQSHQSAYKDQRGNASPGAFDIEEN